MSTLYKAHKTSSDTTWSLRVLIKLILKLTQHQTVVHTVVKNTFDGVYARTTPETGKIRFSTANLNREITDYNEFADIIVFDLIHSKQSYLFEFTEDTPTVNVFRNEIKLHQTEKKFNDYIYIEKFHKTI